MKKILFAMTLALISISAFAQGRNSYTLTTTSAAYDQTATFLQFASNSGMAPAANPDITTGNTTNLTKQLVLIDQEIVEVQSTTGSGFATVSRGMLGTTATPHASGAQAYVGQPSWFPVRDFLGSCSESAQRILPVFSINRASKQVRLYNCIGGTWRDQTLPQNTNTLGALIPKACDFPFGAVALTSSGSSSTSVSTEQYNVSVYVPNSFVATGAEILNGTSTDSSSKRILAVYSISGNLIANTALAGTARLTTASVPQQIAFTGKTIISGPANYILAYQNDTGVANDFMSILASAINLVNTKMTSQTFGTLVNPTTVPTSLDNTKLGPVGCFY